MSEPDPNYVWALRRRTEIRATLAELAAQLADIDRFLALHDRLFGANRRPERPAFKDR